MDSIKEFKFAGYTARLFSNRIDIQQKAFVGVKNETILLKTITNVACGLGKPLEVTTQDGKVHRLNIGGRAAEEWRQAILEAIP